MRFFFLCFISLFVSQLFASVGIGLSFNRTVYMQFEPIYACVTLRNDSGRALLFGNDPKLQGFVLFDIQDSKRRVIMKDENKEISVTGLVMGPGEIKRMIIPIHKYYSFDNLGTYKVRAFVSHNLLPHEYQSLPKEIRISPGVVEWKKTVGIPDFTGNQKARPVKNRTYSIRTLMEQNYIFYYLVIEDEDRVYGVSRLGSQIGRERYSVEVDMLSRIHLLMPVAPQIYHYLTFSIDGQNTESSFWRTTDTIPMLHRDEITGKVIRIGGAVARPGIDFKDPNAGKVTASKILEEEGLKPGSAPRPVRNRGLVDLGAGL